MPRRGRNRLTCNDLQCMRQFAFRILGGPPGTHGPRLTIERPLRGGFRRLCTPLPTAGGRGCSIRSPFHLRVKATGLADAAEQVSAAAASGPNAVRLYNDLLPCLSGLRDSPPSAVGRLLGMTAPASPSTES